MSVTVIDAACGKGKTSFAIQKMNENPQNSYVYVTPLLSEIDRIKSSTKVNFYDPVFLDGRKINGFNNLLCNGFNIATTHSTFANSTNETLELIKQGNYTLILDEVLDVVSELNDMIDDREHKIKPQDIQLLLDKNVIRTDEYGRVEWIDKSYEGSSYTLVEQLAKRGNLLLINDTLFLWEFPVNIFHAFDQVMILTYMFGGSLLKYFLDYHEIEYDLKSVEQSTIDGKYYTIPYRSDCAERNVYRNLIELCTDEKLNNYPWASFSSTWCKRNIKRGKDYEEVVKLKNHLNNFFRNKKKAKAEEIMWSIYESCKGAIEGLGYTKIRKLSAEEKRLPATEIKKLENNLSCYVPCNARATNDYRTRHVLAYLCNIFPNPYIEKFFKLKNISIDKDAIALSFLVQWMFRSRIRDGKPISLYLPSPRMRKLLQNWLTEAV